MLYFFNIQEGKFNRSCEEPQKKLKFHYPLPQRKQLIIRNDIQTISKMIGINDQGAHKKIFLPPLLLVT
jgi:hypothetical protein